jgi:hypothetical protein
MFRKTKFDDVIFEGAIFSNLGIEDLTLLNLNFTDIFAARFYKSNLNKFIEVKSQSSFEKLLKDMG